MRSQFRALRVLAGVALSVSPLLAPPPGWSGGTVFTVDTTADLPDAAIDGICATVEGSCSPRAAVQEANATPESDVINLPRGKFKLKLEGAGEDQAATGDLDILADLTIQGAGADATQLQGKNDRIFEIFNCTVTITDLTVTKGKVGDRDDIGDEFNGGGIRTEGDLTLTDVVVKNNKSSDDGGGIASFGTLTLTRVTVSKNKAGDDAGGVDNDDGTVTMTDTTISKNKAGGETGGLETEGGLMTALRVTIDSNSAKSDAGGVGIEQDGTFEGTNVTISGNKAAENGGGVNLDDSTSTLVLTNVTLKGNKAKEGGAAVSNVFGGSAMLANSLLEKNKKVTCAGVVTSGGGNVEDTDTCGFGVSDLAGIKKLKIAGLKNNGGLTRTHALKEGSPAVDVASDAQCPATDQRGAARVDIPGTGTTTCDSGAFEQQPE
jgi:predicted outer membrane repeat protein